MHDNDDLKGLFHWTSPPHFAVIVNTWRASIRYHDISRPRGPRCSMDFQARRSSCARGLAFTTAKPDKEERSNYGRLSLRGLGVTGKTR